MYDFLNILTYTNFLECVKKCTGEYLNINISVFTYPQYEGTIHKYKYNSCVNIPDELTLES